MTQTRTLSLTGQPEAISGAVRLEIISPGDLRGTFELAVGSCRVGSARPCDWVIKHPSVSRTHAVFELNSNGVRVRDLGSRNGTWTGTTRVLEGLVPLSSSIRLGKVIVRVTGLEQARVAEEADPPPGMIGVAVASRQLFAAMARVAATDLPVLIQGETGSGKDEVARALHRQSRRRSGPFVVLDATRTNHDTFLSEIFGNARGAFTGAVEARAGLIESAHGGTLLIDEIGELTAEAQTGLLRVLERREVSRLGEARPRKVDFRLMAATNRSLEREVAQKRFRADLFYRLAVSMLTVPPLRERAEDIEPLAHAFAAQHQLVLDRFELVELRSRDWPGNVRELKNAVARRAATQALSAGTPQEHPVERRAAARLEIDRAFLQQMLDRAGGNVSLAAREAGVARSQFYRLMERAGLSRKQ